MSVLSDVAVKFLSSIVLLTPNGQFLGCVTITFIDRYVYKLTYIYAYIFYIKLSRLQYYTCTAVKMNATCTSRTFVCVCVCVSRHVMQYVIIAAVRTSNLTCSCLLIHKGSVLYKAIAVAVTECSCNTSAVRIVRIYTKHFAVLRSSWSLQSN